MKKAGSRTARSGFQEATTFSLGGPTYTPILRAQSVSVNAAGSDDFTQSDAEAYETFTSAIVQAITLNIHLDGTVTSAGTPLSNAYVIANIRVIGGSGFGVSDTFCNGQYAFGTY